MSLMVYRNNQKFSEISNPIIHDNGTDEYSVTYEVTRVSDRHTETVEAVKGVSFIRAVEVYKTLTELIHNQSPYNLIKIVADEDNG